MKLNHLLVRSYGGCSAAVELQNFFLSHVRTPVQDKLKLFCIYTHMRRNEKLQYDEQARGQHNRPYVLTIKKGVIVGVGGRRMAIGQAFCDQKAEMPMQR